MSVNFNNCTFNNSNINIEGNTFNSNSSGKSSSDALSLGALLVGGCLFLPTLATTVIPIAVLCAKSVLLGTALYSGGSAIKTIYNAKKESKLLPNPIKCDGLDCNCIELEPISVRDVD